MLCVIGAIGWAFLPAGSSSKSVLVEIPNHSRSREIARRLKEKGIIRSDIAFLIMAELLGETTHMQAGDYELAPRMTLAQIITSLARGDSLAEWVTIPEGFTLRQIAELLNDRKLVDGDRFKRIARVGGTSFRSLSFTPSSNLEGYLFPDSYKLNKKSTERAIIQKMLLNFDSKVARPLRSPLQATGGEGRDLRSILILASLVEKEAKVKKEQPIIAGVLMNRLQIGMRLQCDATVQYALAAPKQRLSLKDLEVASPYNTYRIYGLPPGPICNPGLGAIRAALHPATVQSLYYVAKPDGTHIFSRTLAAHDAARAKVLRMAKEAP